MGSGCTILARFFEIISIIHMFSFQSQLINVFCNIPRVAIRRKSGIPEGAIIGHNLVNNLRGLHYLCASGNPL